MESYFFIAVSTRENVEICKRHALAGFTQTINGAWAYSEINIGDYVTFLYGARAYNLYKVVNKEALADAESSPPWKPLLFRSGRICYFPFRLYLEPIRQFEESIAKVEFAYIAENLLLRGGYRKTHFQADQTTLQNVSQMGKIFKDKVEPLKIPEYDTFTPKFVRAKDSKPPELFQFKEIILQALIRQHLSEKDNFKTFIDQLGLSELAGIEFEVLGEKAIEEGHIDLLVKEARPKGSAKQMLIEVKLGRSSKDDVDQLQSYMDEIGDECVAGVLIAEHIPQKVISPPVQNIHFWRYEFDGIDLKEPHTFEELLSVIRISPL